MSETSITRTLTAHDADHERLRTEDVIIACQSGDLELLRQLLDTAGAKNGNVSIGADSTTGLDNSLPAQNAIREKASSLIACAVANKQPEILTYLIGVYPTFYINSALYSAFSNPDLATFDVLYRHDPSIVNWEDGAYNTALQIALDEGKGNPLIPEFLLDHGADVEGGALVVPPLWRAISLGYPLPLIKKLVDASPRWRTRVIDVAIRCHRLDVALYLLDTNYDLQGKSKLEEDLRRAAKESGDKSVVVAPQKRKNPYANIITHIKNHINALHKT